MHEVPRLLIDLAMVLGVGALTSLLFRWLRLPVVLGYVLAGLVVGPHVPIPLVADEGNVRTLADLGVVLLMFSIGLEFSLGKLFRAGPTALLMGSVQVGFAMALGFLGASSLGWTSGEALFMGAALAIGSTMVLAKLFEEHRPSRALRSAVMSVLVVQDLFAILLLTGLSTYARLGGLPAVELGHTLARLAAFLVLVLGLGNLVVPRLLRWVADHARPESLLIASTALCFVLAAGAAKSGFSLALGAFLAGMLAAESGRVRLIEHLVSPVKNLFAAIFFVAVGMMLDPRFLPSQIGPILLFTALVPIGNLISLTAGGVLAGLPVRTSLQAGLVLGQTGEFGYIILGLGVAAGVVRPELFSVGVAVGVLTTFLTAGVIKNSGRLAHTLEMRLPAFLQANLGLYQAWAESLRQRGIRRGEVRELRRPTLFLTLDGILLAALVVGHHLLMNRWESWLAERFSWPYVAVQTLLSATLGLATAFLLLGMLRQGKVLARHLAVLAPNPEGSGSGRRGRHLLAGGLRIAVVLMVGLPMVAFLLAFAPRGPLLLVALAVWSGTMIIQFLRGRRLHRELPGTAEWLLARVREPWGGVVVGQPKGHGTLRTLRIGSSCPSLHRSLKDLDLQGRAGVTLVALMREGLMLPLHPTPVLQEGDLLALAGPDGALDEAEALLSEPE
ncbi:MAG: cation:proton antiporter [Holophaga sp.]|nr:cation:proton antiporter [Holophaga sp.]